MEGNCCFRSDRVSKRGGGTAIYPAGFPTGAQVQERIKHEAEGTVLELDCQFSSFMCSTSHHPYQQLLWTPSETKFRLLIVDIVDRYLSKNCKNRILIVGDFNHFKTDHLASDLDLVNLVQQPTRSNHILISKNYLTDAYEPQDVTYNAPIGKADHMTLVMVSPHNYHQNLISTSHKKIVYDYRASNMSNLLHKANTEDEIIYEEKHEHIVQLHSKLLALIDSYDSSENGRNSTD